MGRRPALSKAFFVLLLTAGVASYLTFHEEGVKVGDRAPSFSAASRGGAVALDRFRGRVVLLNFWATWCPPCLQELPSLEGLQKRMQGRDFELLAVSLDEGGWTDVDRATSSHTLEVLLDARGEVADLYGAHRLPETFLIDKNGVVVKKYVGPRDWNDPRIVSEIVSEIERDGQGS